MKTALSFLSASTLLLGAQAHRHYHVTAQKLSEDPIISNGTGAKWDYNFNPAVYSDGSSYNLIVRNQDLKDPKIPYDCGPSYLSSSKVTVDKDGKIHAQPPTEVALINPPDSPCGSEDPRITEKDGVYWMTYTWDNCTHVNLALASTKTPFDPKSWEYHGWIVPDRGSSKSGALLLADKNNKLSKNYAFFGDPSKPRSDIFIATSDDGLKWNDTGASLIKNREDKFDSFMVEAGPSPLLLSTGDYFMVYNSAREVVAPPTNLQYNVGFLILDGKDPLTVKQRSEEAIMSPTLVWEIGNSTEYCVANVVFLEGLVPEIGGCPKNVDELVKEDLRGCKHECFWSAYGGSDSAVGAARIIVSWKEDKEEEISFFKEFGFLDKDEIVVL